MEGVDGSMVLRRAGANGEKAFEAEGEGECECGDWRLEHGEAGRAVYLVLAPQSGLSLLGLAFSKIAQMGLAGDLGGSVRAMGEPRGLWGRVGVV